MRMMHAKALVSSRSALPASVLDRVG